MSTYAKSAQVGTRPTNEALRGRVLEHERADLVHRIAILQGVHNAHFNEASACPGDLCRALASTIANLDAALDSLTEAIAANERIGTHAEDAGPQQGHRALPEEGQRQAEGP